MFPYVPRQAGYNKRLRAAAHLLRALIPVLAAETSSWSDDTWLIDSTPVECGRSRPTAQRSTLAGWAGYGYCASHSRFFWGLRLHLICTPSGLPIAYALANPKIDEREVARDLLGNRPRPARRPARPDRHHRQGLRQPRVRNIPPRPRRHPPAPGVQERATPPRRPAAQATAPDHRIGQRHPQRPTRSRTPRRPHPRRCRHPRPPTTPRPHRRHLAQRPDPPTGPTIPHRLRPLTIPRN